MRDLQEQLLTLFLNVLQLLAQLLELLLFLRNGLMGVLLLLLWLLLLLLLWLLCSLLLFCALHGLLTLSVLAHFLLNDGDLAVRFLEFGLFLLDLLLQRLVLLLQV